MLPKIKEHQRAIYLRKQGKSYSEIMSQIRVSQSSLSSWLKNVRLTRQQINDLFLKKKKGQSKGGLAKRSFREKQQKRIREEAAKQIQELSERELWLLGIVAYWCEGTKQKENNVSQGVIFANSDPFLLKLFMKWLREICKIQEDQIIFSIYIHKNANSQEAISYWSEELQIPEVKFGKPIFKKHKVRTIRKNVGNNYHGLIRIAVRKSTNLNRKISGWMQGIDNFIN